MAWHDLDDVAVRHARVLPLDVVQAKGNGHAGTAASLTPALYVLFQEFLRHDPADPDWMGRDRFVLSAGHASLALYVQLYLSGYGLELDDLKAARTFGSATPGHPERGHTAGVETSTGPLGQGVGNAVGLAMEAQRIRALLEPERSAADSLFGRRVWCLASDGDLQEGISHEASSLAGTLGLEGLIVVWDDNQISIEGDTGITFSEDVAARYLAYGWMVVEIVDAEDPTAIRDAFEEAAAVRDRPVLVRLRTRIGHPMPSVGGTAAAHSGAPGAEEIRATKAALGLDPEAAFAMPGDALKHARMVAERGATAHQNWTAARTEWEEQEPRAASLLERMVDGTLSTDALDGLAKLRASPKAAATRIASSAVLDEVSPHTPWLWGGSADLAESNGVSISGAASFTRAGHDSEQWPGGPDGTLVHFGIREHAMGAILNGMALGGLSRPFGATFFVFSDYMRPSVRLAALMNLPVIYVWSHDSIAVGEDGPTHQPVEHLWANRGIPGLDVIRPADWVETVDAWTRLLIRPEGPASLVLSRQGLPVVADSTTYANGAARGAYVIADHDSPDVLLIATGSEVSIALQAREALRDQGVAARVVSAPCLEWFEREPSAYRESVLPPSLRARVSVEAGTGVGWHRYVGLEGEVVSVEDFGSSGAGDLVLAAHQMTVEAVVNAARKATQLQTQHSAGAGGSSSDGQ
nr:transketolase [Ornithinimicrobium sp. HY1745]